MEKWREVAETVGLIDQSIVKLSSKMLDVDIKQSSQLYKDYKKFARISSKLRSDLEEEMLRQNPRISDEEFRGLFYGRKF